MKMAPKLVGMLLATNFICMTITPIVEAQMPPMSQESADEKEEAPAITDKKKFANAQPEDITNENFPDLIESFDYPNADIEEVIKAISELTGKNFIVEPGVKGKVTIIAPSQITVAEAYRAFLSALASLGYTIVPSGKFLKIKNSRGAQRDSIETYSGEYFPTSDQIITRIIKLNYISAEEVDKQLRFLPSKDGEMRPYAPTNSIIITDYGSNIARVTKILNELDVPSFKERLEVVPIRHAKAKDIAELIDQIINKESTSKSSRFSSSRFTRPKTSSSSSTGSVNYSLVIPDERTESIIIVGNEAGIEEIRGLIRKLDFKLNASDSGGVYVYYVKHGEAKTIAETLNGIAQDAKKNNEDKDKNSRRFAPPPSVVSSSGSSSGNGAVLGEDVKITAEEQTNSLIITAKKQDYDVILNLLKKIDIPREQVFVKVVIMDLDATNGLTYGVDIYQFDKGSNGIGRVGFRSSDSVASLINPEKDDGAIIGFGSNDTVKLSNLAGGIEVTSMVGFIKFLKSTVGTNILSEPQIMALDNEEAEIEVGTNVPVGKTQTSTTGGITSGIEFKDATIHLKIKPYISPDSDKVRMEIEQKIDQVAPVQVEAPELAGSAVSTTKRLLKTSIVVNDGDTAVLGGLMQDSEKETIKKVPVLGDIPILGWLFKSRKIEKSKKNLMLFITPKIMRTNVEGADLLTQKLNERIDFIQRNMGGRDPHGLYFDSLPRKASVSPTLDSTAPKESPAVETF